MKNHIYSKFKIQDEFSNKFSFCQIINIRQQNLKNNDIKEKNNMANLLESLGKTRSRIQLILKQL